jgi:hypothetical protein
VHGAHSPFANARASRERGQEKDSGSVRVKSSSGRAEVDWQRLVGGTAMAQEPSAKGQLGFFLWTTSCFHRDMWICMDTWQRTLMFCAVVPASLQPDPRNRVQPVKQNAKKRKHSRTANARCHRKHTNVARSVRTQKGNRACVPRSLLTIQDPPHPPLIGPKPWPDQGCK